MALQDVLAAARARRQLIQEQELINQAVQEAQEAAAFAEYDYHLTLLCHILLADRPTSEETRQLALSLLAPYHEVAWHIKPPPAINILDLCVPVWLCRIAPAWAANIYHPVAYLYNSPPPYPTVDRFLIPRLQAYIEGRILQTYHTLQEKI